MGNLVSQAKRRKNADAVAFQYHSASPPKEIDWVKKEAVTKIKNQQQVKLVAFIQYRLIIL